MIKEIETNQLKPKEFIKGKIADWEQKRFCALSDGVNSFFKAQSIPISKRQFVVLRVDTMSWNNSVLLH